MQTAGCDATKRGRFPVVSQTDLLESNVPPKENVNMEFLIFKSCHSKQWKGECGNISNLYNHPGEELVAMRLYLRQGIFLRSFHVFLPSLPPSFLLVCSQFHLQIIYLNVKWWIQRVNIFLLKDFWYWKLLWMNGPGLHDTLYEWEWEINLLPDMYQVRPAYETHQTQHGYTSAALNRTVGSSLTDGEIKLKVSGKKSRSLSSDSKALYWGAPGTSVCCFVIMIHPSSVISSNSFESKCKYPVQKD